MDSKFTYYKLTNKESTHNGFQFREGLNTDIHEWNPESVFGIYISNLENLPFWFDSNGPMEFIWDVSFPKHVAMKTESYSLKCHSIILANKRRISDMKEWGDESFVKNAFTKSDTSIRYLTNPSEDIQITAIKIRPFSVLYVKNPSTPITRYAVSLHPLLENFITI